jgi:hypothetical protein
MTNKGWKRESNRHRDAYYKGKQNSVAVERPIVPTYESPEEITALVGSDGYYPQDGEDMIRDGFTFNPLTIDAMEDYKWGMPWSGSYDERVQKAKNIVSKLCKVYDMPPTGIEATGDESITNAHYVSSSNTITINKLSVLTLLHEFGHAKGYNERWTVFWSNNLFKQMFPTNWAKLKHADGGTSHVMTCEPVSEEEGRIPINGLIETLVFGQTPITIAAPHDVTSGSGHIGDLHTGEIAKKLARELGCVVVVFTNFRRKDVNINHPKYTCNREVLSSPRGEEVFARYSTLITNPILIEIHGSSGKSNKLMVATNNISREKAQAIKDLSDENIKFYVDQLEDIALPATITKQYGTIGQRISLHIEIPKNLRENSDTLIPYLKKAVNIIVT